MIFELPADYGRLSHPLAYIDWFTPFGRLDNNTGMHQVSRSTRNRKPNADIVTVDRILGACHLVGKSGLEIDRSWGSENVLETASVFLVNPYITIDCFSGSGLYRLQLIS